jgi:hypothetical protein
MGRSKKAKARSVGQALAGFESEKHLFVKQGKSTWIK